MFEKTTQFFAGVRAAITDFGLMLYAFFLSFLSRFNTEPTVAAVLADAGTLIERLDAARAATAAAARRELEFADEMYAQYCAAEDRADQLEEQADHAFRVADRLRAIFA